MKHLANNLIFTPPFFSQEWPTGRPPIRGRRAGSRPPLDHAALPQWHHLLGLTLDTPCHPSTYRQSGQWSSVPVGLCPEKSLTAELFGRSLTLPRASEAPGYVVFQWDLREDRPQKAMSRLVRACRQFSLQGAFKIKSHGRERYCKLRKKSHPEHPDTLTLKIRCYN